MEQKRQWGPKIVGIEPTYRVATGRISLEHADRHT